MSSARDTILSTRKTMGEMDLLERFRLLEVEETGRCLGEGSFSSVVELRYAGLSCAGKIFSVPETDDYRWRLGLSCEMLSQLCHPNIACFFGVYDRVSESGSSQAEVTVTAVVVTEALPMTLEHCIEIHDVLPTETSHSILKDVALGLRYLHERRPPIVHCDLSASNVLLTKGMTAKITDVGAAEVVQWNPMEARIGKKSAHLPPEVFTSAELLPLTKTTKVDVFSYGILVIHTLSGRWPEPSSTFRSPSGARLQQSFSFTEAESLSEYLDVLGDWHPLMSLIRQCIMNNPEHRPEMAEVLNEVSAVVARSPPRFTDSLQMLQTIGDFETEQAKLKKQIRKISLGDGVTPTQMFELERLQLMVDQLKAQNLSLEAAACAKVNSPTLRSLEKRRQSHECTDGSNGDISPVQLRRSRLEWTACADLPVGMYRANGIVIDGKVYVGGGVTGDSATDRLVLEYDPIQDSWTVLPPSPVALFGLGQLFGELVLVGGKNEAGKTTNKLYTFDRAPQMWKQSIPPMTNARYSPAVVSYQSSLFVCAGFMENPMREPRTVTTVEVINTESFRWYVAGYLPRLASLSMCSCITIRDTCYLMGGYRDSAASSASQSSHYTSLTTLASKTQLTPYMWKALPDTPHRQMTAATLGGCLLTLGGSFAPYTMPVQRSIHAYSPSTKSWVYVGNLPYAVCHCTSVTLPSGELLIIGGWVQPGKDKRSRSVYRGTIAL